MARDYKSFQEYLDHKKGGVRNTAPVKTIADYDGPKDSKPPKEKKHKDAGGEGQKGDFKPYKASVNAEDPNKGKLKDGFAGKGDSKLKYEPKTTVPSKVGEGGTKKGTWPKTEGQRWLDKTRDMSLAEFTKMIREDATKKLAECACDGNPFEAMKEAVNVCKCDSKFNAALVREMKRAGVFKKFIVEALQHSEAYTVLAKLMERDESYSRKLVRAMNEMIGPPAHDDLDDEDEEGALAPPAEDDDGMGMDGMGDEDDPMMGMGDEDDPMMGDEDMDMMGDEDPSMMGDEPPPPPHDKIGKIAPPKKKKKKHAHDHLLSAMKDSGPMANSMQAAMMRGM